MKSMRIKNILFICTVMLIFPIPQIAIDLYLPSLPAIAKYFELPRYYIQFTVTVYMITLGCTQLIYGHLSDIFGRKPLLIIGIVVFFIGSIGCFFSGSITQLIIFRILQGCGMGSGFVIGSAILGERFEGKKLAKMTAYSTTIFSLSPLFAPIAGGYIQQFANWQTNFLAMTILSFILFFMVIKFIPETNKNIKKNTSLKQMLSEYCTVLKNVNFMGCVICAIFGFSISITFCIAGPFLLQNSLNLSTAYSGWMLFVIGLAYFVGTLANRTLLNIGSIKQTILCGLSIMFIFSFCLCFLGLLGILTLWSLMLFTFLTVFGTGFIFGNFFAKGLSMFPNNLGLVSAIIGAGGLIGGALITAIVSYVRIYNQFSLGVMFLIETFFCAGSYFYIRKIFGGRL